ncbi:MAG TPA: hypothetical protein PKV41_05585 [Candidatus Omnitrophota bacterium]|nr:hypothetical protein [Candidatus Omnitrophota bacterium]
MSRKLSLFCLASVVVIILAVVIKQSVIRAQRSIETISTFSEWQEKGKPVIVAQAAKNTVDLYTKISIVRSSANTYEAFIPRSIRMKLEPDQSFYINESGHKIHGKVTDVEEELDINSGMFRVQLSLEDGNKTDNQPVIAYINTGSIPDVICVPSSAVDRQGDQNILWIAENERAHKRSVVIKQRNGYGSIIDQGLQEGETVILQGITQLRENDKVNILSRSDIFLASQEGGAHK